MVFSGAHKPLSSVLSLDAIRRSPPEGAEEVRWPVRPRPQAEVLPLSACEGHRWLSISTDSITLRTSASFFSQGLFVCAPDAIETIS
jgi:hypothetical protein